MEKICRICGDLKSIDDFHIKRGTPDDHRNECKECVKIIQKKYKEEPGFKEKGKEYDKKRYQELKDETIQRMRQYRIDNKEEINERLREKRKNPDIKNKWKQWFLNNKDVMAKHQMNYRKRYPHIVAWRSILYSTLDRMGTTKEGHTVDELGYSAQELKEHIEGQFTKGMSWENHGDWHIDHKRCVVDFPPETSVKVVCSLLNLRPMWATTRDIDGITYEGNLNKNSRSDY